MRFSDCHPSVKHHAKGLCLECYTRDIAVPRARAWYAANKARAAKRTAEWRRQHPEQVRVARNRWRDANPEAVAASRQAWREANPEKLAEIRRNTNVNRYGISIDTYEAMLVAQDGACKLCKRKPTGRRLNIDHCHSTGAVRGLLCNICNMMMGLVDSDADFIERVRGYGDAPRA